MWKARAVVALRIGGIQDQIVDGRSGILLDESAALGPYREAGILRRESARARALRQEAQQRVRDQFLDVRSLMQYRELIARLPS